VLAVTGLGVWLWYVTFRPIIPELCKIPANVVGAWTSSTASDRGGAVIRWRFETQRRKPVVTYIARSGISEPIIDGVMCVNAQAFFSRPINAAGFWYSMRHWIVKIVLAARCDRLIRKMNLPRFAYRFSVWKRFSLQSRGKIDNFASYSIGAVVNKREVEHVAVGYPVWAGEAYERTLSSGQLLLLERSLLGHLGQLTAHCAPLQDGENGINRSYYDASYSGSSGNGAVILGISEPFPHCYKFHWQYFPFIWIGIISMTWGFLLFLYSLGDKGSPIIALKAVGFGVGGWIIAAFSLVHFLELKIDKP